MQRVAVGLVVLSMAGFAGGCWMAALQFAPAVARGAVNLGTGVLSLGGGAKIPAAGIIELRTAAGGAPEYRELLVDDSGAEPRWVPRVADDTSPEGWLPAVNFPQMNFAPPLQFPATGTSYLAYLQIQKSQPLPDDDRMELFIEYFGRPAGTFVWQGDTYKYALPRGLPSIEPQN